MQIIKIHTIASHFMSLVCIIVLNLFKIISWDKISIIVLACSWTAFFPSDCVSFSVFVDLAALAWPISTINAANIFFQLKVNKVHRFCLSSLLKPPHVITFRVKRLLVRTTLLSF